MHAIALQEERTQLSRTANRFEVKGTPIRLAWLVPAKVENEY